MAATESPMTLATFRIFALSLRNNSSQFLHYFEFPPLRLLNVLGRLRDIITKQKTSHGHLV
ncbi:hypothetical protein E2C01_055440 [Portunus trituberculatus]|uniref:Uncharacterized protein n=1 Tax=Portunus trituberculatus TaxID=210409 RepID=A0A5B7GMG3_PORTR|nr:hypothetical protein [Portunus trituberculatus]